jgi:hypothetical protein
MMMGVFGIVLAIGAMAKLSGPMNMLIGLLVLGAVAWMAFNSAMTMGMSIAATVGALMVGVGAIKTLFPKEDVGGAHASTMKGSGFASQDNSMRSYDTGGRFMPSYYDTGGLTNEHGMAVLQKGETVVSRSQNMAGGSEAFGGGGPSIIIQGDVYDADKFTEKIAQVLPGALRSSNDIGAI